jgi:hypothetical protein
MSAPHDNAVGTYGNDAVNWLDKVHGVQLRWWQCLALARILEHDAAGALIWSQVLLSTPRQVGKSWLLRALAQWRLESGPTFGEPQLVLHTAKDLPICREVQRPARLWARMRKADGWQVREGLGQESIESPDGSRWVVRGRDSVYGYSTSLGIVDEAWSVDPTVVEDGIEPTMPERTCPQLVLVSTAHRAATPLMLGRREQVITTMDAPASTLLLEWSAGPDAVLTDPADWRMASPIWTPQRQQMMADKLQRAQAGLLPEATLEESDPLEAFKAQWLNIWPTRSARASRTEAVLDASLWRAAADVHAVPTGPLVLGVEDWFGRGSAAAAVAVLPDGRLLCWGSLCARRVEAFEWVARWADRHPGSRLVIGASLEHDTAAAAVGIPVTLATTATTRMALPLLRELLNSGGVVHDAGPDLTDQALNCRATVGNAGLSLVSGTGRSDLLRAVAWCAAESTKAPAKALPKPAIY